MSGYNTVAEELVQRIVELADENQEVISVTDPFKLFSYGLRCDDLSLSLAQAQWALAEAKRRMGFGR